MNFHLIGEEEVENWLQRLKTIPPLNVSCSFWQAYSRLCHPELICLKRDIAVSKGQTVECMTVRHFTEKDTPKLEVWVGSGQSDDLSGQVTIVDLSDMGVEVNKFTLTQVSVPWKGFLLIVGYPHPLTPCLLSSCPNILQVQIITLWWRENSQNQKKRRVFAFNFDLKRFEWQSTATNCYIPEWYWVLKMVLNTWISDKLFFYMWFLLQKFLYRKITLFGDAKLES